MGGNHNWNLYFVDVTYTTKAGETLTRRETLHAAGIRDARKDASDLVRGSVPDLKRIVSATVS